ncbi:hypothetical protein GCM10022197_32880 [Microlunatus spumicola]|uniref:DUF4240 domain-containing protein n=1 Tax=Microlunatus spumicola TaxID=81499 RepID=A0ABP6XXP1_9ACTN
MRVAGEQLWALLRELDDPDHLETPAGFDLGATRERFERLVGGLDEAFGCRTDADRSVQDASLHARVVVPAGSTSSGERLVVCVSNFGGLATVSLTNPGVFDSAELHELLHADDAAHVYGVLDDLDYVVIPEDPLWTTYDGPSQITVDARWPASWWTRFFDYL